MKFDCHKDIYQSFLSLIQTPPTQFGSFGLDRIKYLASLVGNPQDSYPVIHVAGTSGKGSTATCTVAILQAHGYKTGLHLSPHLLDRRERVQLDGAFIADDILVQAAEKLFPAIEQCRQSEYGQPSYYEAMMVFVYLCFALAQVDVAVVEVGCGGLYDGSNIVTRQDKISVITRQGYDHQDIVGETLQEISYNDAGIILPGSRVVALRQDEEICNQTIQTYADTQNAAISWVMSSGPVPILSGVQGNETAHPAQAAGKDLDNYKDSSLRSEGRKYENIRLKNNQTIFDYDNQKDIRLGLVGLFQAENAALAIAATQLFCPHFDRAKTRIALEKARFMGRLDIHSLHNRTVILDGAHNPQKMQALVETLKVLFPNKKIVRYAAFKQGKDWKEMLHIMQTISNDFILGSFAETQDMTFTSVSHEDVGDYIHGATIQSIHSPEDFFDTMDILVDQESVVVVTGSLYWLSKVYATFS